MSMDCDSGGLRSTRKNGRNFGLTAAPETRVGQTPHGRAASDFHFDLERSAA